MVVRRTSLSGSFHVGSWVAQRWLLGGQAGGGGGGSLTRSNSVVQAVSQGQAFGRCRVIRRAEVATRAGTVISLRRMVAVVAFARSGAGEVAGGAGEVERDDREHQPGGVGGEHPGGQVRQRGVLQVGVDLLDDRVPAVGLVGGDGVRIAGSVVVKKAWNRHTSNRVSWPAALFFSALKSGIRRTTSRPGTWSAFFCAANAVNGISATSAREIQRPVVCRRRRRRCTRSWSTRRRRSWRSPS